MSSQEQTELLSVETSLSGSTSKKIEKKASNSLMNGTRDFIKGFAREFILNGAERVNRKMIDGKDLILNKDDKVAEYEVEHLIQYWNDHVMKKCFWHNLTSGVRNIICRTFPLICGYLFMFYVFMAILQTFVCPPSIANSFHPSLLRNCQSESCDIKKENIIKTENLTSEYQDERENFCLAFIRKQEILIENERILNRLLTFFIGFYVSFIVRNWWQNMKTLPSINTICISLNAFISTDFDIKEEDAEIKVLGNIVSVKKFKKDICRLSFLTWAMCFCRMSCRLKEKLNNPEAFYRSGLLTEVEYAKLKTNNEDAWLERWDTPLLWANKMIWNVRKKCEKEECKENASSCELKNFHRILFNNNGSVEKALLAFRDSLESLSKQYYFPVPGLMQQVINLALYFFIGIGVFAGQSLRWETTSLIEQILLNFPLYYCAKYVLLIGWAKIAEDLKNPFGDDIYDVDLPVVLDYQIWKASYMLSQTTPYEDEGETKDKGKE